MDQEEQNSKADELTRNRFVERAVEAYQASAQNTEEHRQRNSGNHQSNDDEFSDEFSVDDGQQSTDGPQINPIIADLQATLREGNDVTQQVTAENHQVVEPHQVLNDRHESGNDQQSGNILPELQLAFNLRAQRELRERIHAIRVPTNETLAPPSIEHVSQRVCTRPLRPQKPPKPESINMRSALERFRQMEFQNEPKYLTNNLPRPNTQTTSENTSLQRPSRPEGPQSNPILAELQATLRERSSRQIPPLIPPRIFETSQRLPNAETQDSLDVDTSDPLNQSLMVDIGDAESIRHLVELGFDESDATHAFFAAERNLEEAIELLLEQNA